MDNHALWLTTRETAVLVGFHISTIMRFCAERRIHPRCGRKMGGKWRFKREVIENEGLILKDDEKNHEK